MIKNHLSKMREKETKVLKLIFAYYLGYDFILYCICLYDCVKGILIKPMVFHGG